MLKDTKNLSVRTRRALCCRHGQSDGLRVGALLPRQGRGRGGGGRHRHRRRGRARQDRGEAAGVPPLACHVYHLLCLYNALPSVS